MSADSVAARLAAHLSTPYIVAPGRTERAPLVVAGVPTDDRLVPLCLLPPDEFRRRTAAESKGSTGTGKATLDDLDRIASLEAGIEKINRKMDESADSIRAEAMKRDVTTGLSLAKARLAHRLQLAQNAGASQTAPSPVASRQHSAAAATAAEKSAVADVVAPSAAEDLLRQSRAMARERGLRDREADINARRDRLAQARAQAAERVEAADQRAKAQAAAIDEAHRRELEAVQAAQRDANEAEGRKRAAEEASRVAEQRRREDVLQDELDRVKREAAMEIAVWQQRVKSLVQREEAALALARDKEVSLLALEADQAAAKAEQRFDLLQLLLERYEAHAAELKDFLARRPTTLMRLVIDEAKERSKEVNSGSRGVGDAHGPSYPGLELLCAAGSDTPR